MKKIKISFFVSKTIPFNAGSGRSAFRFSHFLSKSYKTKLIAVNDNLFHSFHTKINDLSIYRLPYLNKNNLLKLLSFPILALFQLYFLINSNIIICYGKFIGFEMVILISSLLNKKVIFQSTLLNDDDVETLITKSVFPKPIAKYAIKQIDVFYSINNIFAKKYLHYFPTKEYKILQASQGVNTELFFPLKEKKKGVLRKKLGIQKDCFVIITIGYLIKRKGFEEIFEVLSQIDINYKYLVLGDYSVNSKHYAYYRKAEMIYLFNKGKKMLGNNLEFIGPKENISDYLQSSDIFILNSLNEGLPNSLLEAMACGIPPIVRKIEGMESLFLQNNSNALIINNQKELLKSIELLYKDTQLRKKIGTNAHELIIKNHSFSKTLKKILEKLNL